jgi:hypothetical protein
MYKSVITNLIGSIWSPYLRSVTIKLDSAVGEVERFPWEVVNNLAKVSPHMLQVVEIAFRLANTDPEWWTTSPLVPNDYEGYFRQVRSALPGFDKKVVMSIIASSAVRHSSQLFGDSHILTINSPNTGRSF